MTATAAHATAAPTGAANELRAMWRVTLNQLHISMRYTNKFRIELAGHVLVLLPVILTAWAFADGRSSSRLQEMTGLPDQFTFIVLGFIAFTALGVGNMILQDTHVSGGVAYEMMAGTLERMFAAPLRRVTLIFGIGNYYVLLFTFQAVALFLGAWLIFGFELSLTGVGIAWAVYVFAALLALNMSIGLLGAALTLAFKDNQVYLLAVHRPAVIASGAYFLVELMPQPFRALAYVNPIAYCVDGFRGALTGRTLLMSSLEAEMAVIAGFVVATAIAAAVVYMRLMQRMQREGSLSVF